MFSIWILSQCNAHAIPQGLRCTNFEADGFGSKNSSTLPKNLQPRIRLHRELGTSDLALASNGADSIILAKSSKSLQAGFGDALSQVSSPISWVVRLQASPAWPQCLRPEWQSMSQAAWNAYRIPAAENIVHSDLQKAADTINSLRNCLSAKNSALQIWVGSATVCSKDPPDTTMLSPYFKFGCAAWQHRIPLYMQTSCASFLSRLASVNSIGDWRRHTVSFRMKALKKKSFSTLVPCQFSDSLVRCVLEEAIPSLQSPYLDSEKLREECVMWVTKHERKSFMWLTVDCQSSNISWYFWESGTDSTSIFWGVFIVSKPNSELGPVPYVDHSIMVIEHLGPCQGWFWLGDWPLRIKDVTVTPLRTCFCCGKMWEATDKRPMCLVSLIGSIRCCCSTNFFDSAQWPSYSIYPIQPMCLEKPSIVRIYFREMAYLMGVPWFEDLDHVKPHKVSRASGFNPQLWSAGRQSQLQAFTSRRSQIGDRLPFRPFWNS